MSDEHRHPSVEEEDDPLVNQQGCGKAYAKLEDCLADNNRDWRLCQREVHALRDCYAEAQQRTAPHAKPAAQHASQH